MAIELATTQIKQTAHTMHNYYEIAKFYNHEGLGRLLNRYQQRLMLVTEDFIVGFQLAIQEEIGDAGELMFRCGYEWGQKDIQGFERRFREEFGRPLEEMVFGMVLATWWWPLQVTGWGAWQYDLSHRQEGLIFIDLYDSAVARSIGNVGKAVCHCYTGLFAAVFSHLARRELLGIEIQCCARGDSCCKFLIGSQRRINAAQIWVREGANAQDVIARL